MQHFMFFIFFLRAWGKVKLKLTALPRFFKRIVRQFNSIVLTIRRLLAYASVAVVMTALFVLLAGWLVCRFVGFGSLLS